MVYAALTGKRHVFIEGGTGIGKTLAYLAPAILSGMKVVISTGTKALQEQLFHKDVPLIRKALSTPFQVAYMKGRSNYLCLNRFSQFQQAPLFERSGDGALFEKMPRWVDQTKRGDVSELSGLDETSSLWRQLNARPETCLGGKCPDLNRCFITAMRREAARADLIIVNHHLFFADRSIKGKGYGEVIPDYDAVIFDEAHMIEDVATHHFGLQVSNYRFDELVRDTRYGMSKASKGKRGAAVLQVCNRLEGESKEFFSLFSSGPMLYRLDGETLKSSMVSQGDGLTTALTGLAECITQFGDRSEDLASCGRRAGELAGELHAILHATDGGQVYWCEIRGKGVFLHASPVDVAEALEAQVFSHVDSAILTSATLTVGGDFSFIKRRLGLMDADELSLPSPFNLADQVLLYLPAMHHEPNGAGFDQEAADEIEGILAKTRGRAFVLFTSNQRLNAVYRLLEDKLDYPVLKQGEASREELLQRFRNDTHSVLFATRSFWQGIDVAGEALSCVIIDKLPFASPGDPLVSARIDAIRQRGGNSFYEYQLPEAVIALKQGFGRLVRSHQDYGVLSILDRRITSRSYGRIFLKSLSP
ncbi:MAG: helicase C-terminal domain-containing protein [bacterium]|nr:helicase C-terminal domain-containing protein [bacterium]